jgi:hypothetical protein
MTKVYLFSLRIDTVRLRYSLTSSGAVCHAEWTMNDIVVPRSYYCLGKAHDATMFPVLPNIRVKDSSAFDSEVGEALPPR